MIEREGVQCYDPLAFLRGEPELNTDAAGSAPPDAFGPFRVLHQIGAGALGPVFRAYHPEQDRLVAVKMFRLGLSPDLVHRFVADLERLIAADLSHPGIATPLAAGIADVSAYLAQDFVASDSLDIFVRDSGPGTAQSVARTVAQLAAALDLAADNGVLHGALHPRDVLLSPDDVRMTGLGIVQALEGIGAPPPIRRPYSAPERVAGGAWDRRADVFGLAALTFELLSGRRISGPGEPAIESLTQLSAPVRDALRRVLSRALEETPKDRFATAGDFSGALQEALEPPARSAPPRRVVERDTPREPIQAPAVVPPLPVEELPLLTDEMLAEEESHGDVPAAPAEDAGPPPIAEVLATLPDHRIVKEEAPLPIELPGVERDLPWSSDSFRAEPENDANVAEVAETLRASASRRSTTDLGLRAGDTERAAAAAPLSTLVLPEPASSGVRPLILALVVGIAIGFGTALLFLGRDRSPASQTAAVVPSAERAPTVVEDPPIHQITEKSVAVPAGGRAAAALASPAPAPAGRGQAPAGAAAATPAARATQSAPAATVSRGATTTAPRTVVAARPAAPAAASPASRANTQAQSQQRPTVPQPPTPTAPPRPAASAPVSARAQPAPRPAAPPAESRTAKTGPGVLVVESRPSGANVFVDGKLVGRTPLTTETVALGEHAIHLDLDGYKRWASSVRVASGEHSRIAASLEP